MSELMQNATILLECMLLISAQVLLILVIRKPVNRIFGACNAYRLWALPLLCLPWYWLDIDLPLFMNTVEKIIGEQGPFSKLASQVTDNPEAALQSLNLNTLSAALTASAEKSGIGAPGSGLLWSGALFLWGVIATLMLFWFCLRTTAFNRQIKTRGRKLDHSEQFPGYACAIALPGLSSPAVYGVFRPQLLLPEDFRTRLDPAQQALVLAHECVHLQRRDNLWNLLFTLLRIAFWFNPLFHLAWHRFRLDQEMSCDAKVLDKTSPAQRKTYLLALLQSFSASPATTRLPHVSTWGQLEEIRGRTEMIRYHHQHNPRIRSGLAFLFACLLMSSLSTIVVSQPADANLDRQIRKLDQAVRILAANTERQQQTFQQQTVALDKQAPLRAREDIGPSRGKSGAQEAFINVEQQRKMIAQLERTVSEQRLVELASQLQKQELKLQVQDRERLQNRTFTLAQSSVVIDELSSGAGDQASSTPVRAVKIVPPEYPGRARARGIEGYAIVGLTVNARGEVKDPVILESSPERVFERNSLKAIAEFRFEPRTENGMAVDTNDVNYCFNFVLDDNASASSCAELHAE